MAASIASDRPDKEGGDVVWYLAAISTVFVITGIPQMPYGWYLLIRSAICLTAIVYAVQFSQSRALTQEQRLVWVAGFVTIAVLHNPIFRFRFGMKLIWIGLNAIALVLFWGGLAAYWRAHKERR